MVGVLEENERKQSLRTPRPGWQQAQRRCKAGPQPGKGAGAAWGLPPHARRGRKRSPPTWRGGAWESECSGLGASRSQAGDEDVPRPVNSLAASWASVPSLRSAGGRLPAEPRPPPASPLPAGRAQQPQERGVGLWPVPTPAGGRC